MSVFKRVSILGLAIVLGSCGSSDKKEKKLEERVHEGIQRDYVVTDASSNSRPGWIEDAEVWASQDARDLDEHRYFSFETEPKVNRRVACDLAKANARADIAAEIRTFIETNLVSTTEGSAAIDENNPSFQAMKDYTETTLVEKVQAMIHGSSILKTYWEKRNYKEDLGARRDFIAYTCGVFVQMDRGRLDDAIQKAVDMVTQQADDPAVQERARKALDVASENFKQMQKI